MDWLAWRLICIGLVLGAGACAEPSAEPVACDIQEHCDDLGLVCRDFVCSGPALESLATCDAPSPTRVDVPGDTQLGDMQLADVDGDGRYDLLELDVVDGDEDRSVLELTVYFAPDFDRTVRSTIEEVNEVGSETLSRPLDDEFLVLRGPGSPALVLETRGGFYSQLRTNGTVAQTRGFGTDGGTIAAFDPDGDGIDGALLSDRENRDYISFKAADRSHTNRALDYSGRRYELVRKDGRDHVLLLGGTTARFYEFDEEWKPAGEFEYSGAIKLVTGLEHEAGTLLGAVVTNPARLDLMDVGGTVLRSLLLEDDETVDGAVGRWLWTRRDGESRLVDTERGCVIAEAGPSFREVVIEGRDVLVRRGSADDAQLLRFPDVMP